jgi:ectoine hydroxylase-related dioxygenase (phytanoyl-CoA dioxygenase family)
VAVADAADMGTGKGWTTRVRDFVNRGPAFDQLYIYQPVLDACCRLIGQPFRLSSLLSRTLRPRSGTQALHVDYAVEADITGWPMVGFILMVDEFSPDNGATRFIPGSHRWPAIPTGFDELDIYNYDQVSACGPAGSIIVYNGSVLHGHGVNATDTPRRSLQGAYIRREAASGENLPDRMRPETLERISPLARYLLTV